LIEYQRGAHTGTGNIFYVDPINGDSYAGGSDGSKVKPLLSVQDCHDNLVTDSNHDIVILVPGAAGATTLTENVTLSKRYTFYRGPGRDFLWTRSGAGHTIEVTGDGNELSGFQLSTDTIGVGDGVNVNGCDFLAIRNIWVNQTQGSGIDISNSTSVLIDCITMDGAGVSGAGHGISITPAGGGSDFATITNSSISSIAGDGIRLNGASVNNSHINNNMIHDCTGYGINIVTGVVNTFANNNSFGNNTLGDIGDSGTNSVVINNEQWLKQGDTILIENTVWDAELSGNSHNDTTSSGRRLRDISTGVIMTGTTNNGNSTVNTIVLDNDASAVDGAYDPAMISITNGTGAGQTRLIYQYDGATKTAVVDRNWKVVPDITSEYTISAHPGREHVNEGLAQGGDTYEIILNVLASDFDDTYVGQLIFVRSGLGEDQIRQVLSYNGTTKVAIVTHAWDVIPDSTTGYVMLPEHLHTLAEYVAELMGSTLVDIESTDIDTGNTITFSSAVRAIFNRFFRRVTQDSTDQKVFNDSNAVISTMPVSDDGTNQTKGTS